MNLPVGFAMPAALPVCTIGEALVQRICLTAHAAKEPLLRATGAYRFDDSKTAPQPLIGVPELADGVRNRVPFVFI